VLHIEALHGAPYDGHSLGDVIKKIGQWTGVVPKRAHIDKGYRGDKINAVLCDLGQNIRPLLKWFSASLRLLLEIVKLSLWPSRSHHAIVCSHSPALVSSVAGAVNLTEPFSQATI